jgi:hypothetical protein
VKEEAGNDYLGLFDQPVFHVRSCDLKEFKLQPGRIESVPEQPPKTIEIWNRFKDGKRGDVVIVRRFKRLPACVVPMNGLPKLEYDEAEACLL